MWWWPMFKLVTGHIDQQGGLGLPQEGALSMVQEGALIKVAARRTNKIVLILVRTITSFTI